MQSTILSQSSSSASGSQAPPKAEQNRTRYTKKDISKLPRAMVRSRTKEEIDELFDDEGYLLQPFQATIDLGITANKCNVCQKPTKSTCSLCKMVFYCSPVCQKSHWKTHKPMCKTISKLIAKEPIDMDDILSDPDEAASNDSSFANLIKGSMEMRKEGRKHGSVRSMLQDWLTDKPERFLHGGNIETSSMSSSHTWTVANDDGRIVLCDELEGKKRVSFPENCHGVQLEKYISKRIEDITRKLAPPLLGVYANSFTMPLMDLCADTTVEYNSAFIRRGAEVSFLGGNRWHVVQFVPELLQQSDVFADPSMAGRKYVW